MAAIFNQFPANLRFSGALVDPLPPFWKKFTFLFFLHPSLTTTAEGVAVAISFLFFHQT